MGRPWLLMRSFLAEQMVSERTLIFKAMGLGLARKVYRKRLQRQP